MLQITLIVVAVFVCAGQAHSPEEKESVRAAPCNWIPKSRRNECPTNPPMDNDVLKYRQSGLLAEPSNQGTCGNCWAFAATHTLTDRLSLSMGQRVPLLSPQDLVTCIPTSTIPNGCCGATAPKAYSYIHNTGTVDNTCKPYSESGYYYNPMLTEQMQTPLVCNRQCVNSNNPYNRSSYSLRGYKHLTSVPDMINELQNGPISVAFRVPIEFRDYACGIFCLDGQSGKLLGGHAVEIVDYGTENGLDYWVVKNSWGVEDFGEKGYFRIRRGRDDFYIETRRVHAPIISGDEAIPPQSDSNELDSTSECAPSSMNVQDEEVQKVAQFVVESLQGKISCSDGSTTGSGAISVEKVDTAMSQIVAGEILTLMIDGKLEGCTDEAYIEAQVYIGLDGEYELLDYQYFPSPPTPTSSTPTPTSSSLATCNSMAPLLYIVSLCVAILLHT